MNYPWNIITFTGKPHYFNGHVQWQTVSHYQRVSSQKVNIVMEKYHFEWEIPIEMAMLNGKLLNHQRINIRVEDSKKMVITAPPHSNTLDSQDPHNPNLWVLGGLCMEKGWCTIIINRQRDIRFHIRTLMCFFYFHRISTGKGARSMK